MKAERWGSGSRGLAATPVTPTAKRMAVAAMRRVTDVPLRYLGRRVNETGAMEEAVMVTRTTC